MKIFLTGGTGMVGTRLVERLLERGDQVTLLTRRPDAVQKKWGDKVGVVQGDPTIAGPWQDALRDCDGVVNLVGEGIFNRRWSADFKETMRTSRIDSTRNIAQALARNPRRDDGSPRVLVSASAIGLYGPHGDEELTEESSPANDYLAQLCSDWEKANEPAQSAGVRVAIVRIGVVLDVIGGALAKMLTPFKMFVGGPVGSGNQVMSWIHHEDLVGLILFALDRPDAVGPFNATAPNPVSNRVFSAALGKTLGRPSFMPTPGFMLHLALGEVASVVTQGQRVLPRHALSLGYKFQFTDVEPALADLLKK